MKVDIGVFYTMREDGSCVTVRFLFCFGCCFGFCFDCTALDVEAKGYRSLIVVHVAWLVEATGNRSSDLSGMFRQPDSYFVKPCSANMSDHSLMYLRWRQ